MGTLRHVDRIDENVVLTDRCDRPGSGLMIRGLQYFELREIGILPIFFDYNFITFTDRLGETQLRASDRTTRILVGAMNGNAEGLSANSSA